MVQLHWRTQLHGIKQTVPHVLGLRLEASAGKILENLVLVGAAREAEI